MRTMDHIALIVTITVSIIMIVIIVSPLITGRPLSDDKAQIVGSLISSFIAIIGMYVGAKVNRSK